MFQICYKLTKIMEWNIDKKSINQMFKLVLNELKKTEFKKKNRIKIEKSIKMKKKICVN